MKSFGERMVVKVFCHPTQFFKDQLNNLRRIWIKSKQAILAWVNTTQSQRLTQMVWCCSSHESWRPLCLIIEGCQCFWKVWWIYRPRRAYLNLYEPYDIVHYKWCHMVAGFPYLSKRGSPGLVFYVPGQLHRLFCDHLSEIWSIIHNKLIISFDIIHFGQY